MFSLSVFGFLSPHFSMGCAEIWRARGRRRNSNVGTLETLENHLGITWCHCDFLVQAACLWKMEHFPEIPGYFGRLFEVLLQKKAVNIATKIVVGDLHAHAIHRGSDGCWDFSSSAWDLRVTPCWESFRSSPNRLMVSLGWLGSFDPINPGFYSWPAAVWLGYIGMECQRRSFESHYWAVMKIGYRFSVIDSLGSTPPF